MQIKIFLIFLIISLSLTTVKAFQTRWCYQETANVSTDCGGLSTGNYSFPSYYFNINYSKPINWNNTALNSSLWQVSHGSPQSTYNISLPFSCWNYSTSILVLRIYSQHRENVISSSIPSCYNGSDWVDVGLNKTSIQINCGAGSIGMDNLFDTLWTVTEGSAYSYDNGFWTNGFTCSGGSISANASIYEEAMYWNIEIPPLAPNQIDFSKFNYIKQFGKLMHNHNVCVDNATLGHNITYQITIDQNQSIVNVWEYEPCEFGCDSSTMSCNQSPINQYLLVGVILLVIVIIILILIKASRK
jgi:hypothetical protein